MKITKKQLRRIIKEEARKLQTERMEEEQGTMSSQDLINWFVEKRMAIRGEKIATNQIPALIDAMNSAIEAAKAGKLKAKGDYLSGIMSRISGK